RPFRVQELQLQVRADGDHSVPTKLHVTTDGDDSVDVDVPSVTDVKNLGRTVTVRVPLPEAISGTRLRIEITDVREVRTTDWYSQAPITMPIGIAEVGVVAPHTAPTSLSGACRRDLLTIDGRHVGVRITGSIGDAVQRQPLTVALCDQSAQLAAGTHELRTAPGARTAFDIDRLVLTSGAGGSAAAPPGAGGMPTADTGATVRVVHQSRASMTVEVSATNPFWLVLGESNSRGWHASDGLGEPTLVDGYANGWLVRPKGPGPMRITLTFTPQRVVNGALLASAFGALLCLGLVLFAGRRQLVGVAAAPGPVWTSPFAPIGTRPRAGGTVALALGVGAVAALVDQPLVGAAIAVATLLALLVSRGPRLLALAGIASLGLAGAFTVAKQWRNHYPADFGWPSFFSPAHDLALAGLLLTLASAAAGALRRRGARRARPR
ncbi:MAG: arabinofuranan 3-O-arabinosyltransferase, partial [Actinomycetota bacterium]